MRVLLCSLSVGVLLILGAPHAATAQTAYSLSGGLPFAPSVTYIRNPGFALQASVGQRSTHRTNWRVDASVTEFDAAITRTSGTSLQHWSPTIGLAGLAANEVVTLRAPADGARVYLIGGVESDWLYRHPETQGALRLGASMGLGVAWPLEGHRTVFLEARYHGLMDEPQGLGWLVPVTFGLRF